MYFDHRYTIYCGGSERLKETCIDGSEALEQWLSSIKIISYKTIYFFFIFTQHKFKFTLNKKDILV